MHRSGLRPAAVLAVAALWAAAPLAGQGRRRTPAPAATPAAAPAADVQDSLNDITFRNVGPSVAGGRVAAVAGIPGRPEVYYVGAGGGGVWKTTDGGETWDAVFKDQPTASIGAIALAPSNPNLVWVGTGEANIRNDVLNGHGVYFSPDGGATWEFKGLGDVGQISQIVVDPADPDVVFVAALGHAWTPNADRGVFRTADGGKTWQKVLFVNDTTGAADLIMDPGNPRVLFAAMWQGIRHPWQLVSGGAGSGIYRSEDGGLTWKRLAEGLPPGIYGRIALAAAPSNPRHVYALVEAKTGMLWESTDLGDHWRAVSDNHALDVRPFYFSGVRVSPTDEHKLYFISFQLLESDDGGKTAHPIDQGVHVDHHALWIDPTDGDRMIQGNDGGAYATVNGGATWHWFNNLPIGQFYMVAADHNDPYKLCGGLQDNNAWCGPSSSPAGRITGGEWFTVTGGDGQYAVPAPSDSDVLYVDSQNGFLERLDLRAGDNRFIRPYMPGVEEFAPSQLKYRFNWTTPIEVSRTDANEVWIGANVVFKTTDGGQHWSVISPDLTRDDKTKQVTSGGPIEYDISGAETYNTILTVNVAPTDTNVLWVGTDDGLVQVTRDGGRTWTNVAGRFPGLPANTEGRVYQIGVSPFDAGAAYVTVDRHEFNDDRPYVFKTTDYGKTWTDIGRGLPADAAAHVVREDPNARNFLVLGTDAALWYSRDGGATWRKFTAGFPTAPVFDVKFVRKTHDLLVATHGRGLFVLDDISALEGATPAVLAEPLHVFPSLGAALRLRVDKVGVSPTPLTVPNPPAGAVVDYWLKSAPDTTAGRDTAQAGPRGRFFGRRGGKAVVTVTDAKGDTVVVDSSAPSRAGFNRYVWNLRYRGATPLALERAAGGGGGGGFRGAGPRAIPGSYTVTVAVNGQSASTPVEVRPDPNVPGSPERFQAQLAAALKVRAEQSALNEMLNRIASLETQIRSSEDAMKTALGADTGAARAVAQAARPLSRKLKELKDSLWNSEVQRNAPEDDIHYLGRFHDRYQGLGRIGFGYAAPPNDAVLETWKELRGELDQYLARFNAILSTDVPAFNTAVSAHGAPTVAAGPPVTVKE